jgi:hypothetical protein
MHCEGKWKLRSHNTSYCLIEVITETGLAVILCNKQRKWIAVEYCAKNTLFWFKWFIDMYHSIIIFIIFLYKFCFSIGLVHDTWQTRKNMCRCYFNFIDWGFPKITIFDDLTILLLLLTCYLSITFFASKT